MRNRLLVIVLFLIICVVQALVLYVFAKIKKRKEKKRMDEAERYATGRYDPEGMRFKASERKGNYSEIVCYAALVGFACVTAVRMIADETIRPDHFGFALAGMAGVVILFIACIVSARKKLTCHLTVDEKGIRGLCAKEHRSPFQTKYEEMDIRWEQVKKGSVEGDTLYLYTGETEEQKQAVFLSLFPVLQVRDCVNYFYMQHQQKQNKPQKPLLPPAGIEDNVVVQWIVILVSIAITAWIGYKILD
jgi:hypothetical protein